MSEGEAGGRPLSYLNVPYGLGASYHRMNPLPLPVPSQIVNSEVF